MQTALFDLVAQIHDELLEHNHGIFRIIADAGGHVEIRSERGRGTMVRLVVPASTAP